MPFSAAVADSVKMSDFAPSNGSDVIQLCQPRSTFTDLPASCLAVVVYVNLPKNYDYSSTGRSFACTVCGHGHHLDDKGLCQPITNCDSAFADKDGFFNGCGACAGAHSLTFFNNNGNDLTLTFDVNKQTNSDLDNQTSQANRYAGQWVYNHHDMSATPSRDIYSNSLFDSINEVDYTSCHDTSSEPTDQADCLVYDFLQNSCAVCNPGHVKDNFGSCQQSLAHGCAQIGDREVDMVLALDPAWANVAFDSTAEDSTRLLASDLQALAYYSGTGRTCSSCEFGWKQYVVFAEDVFIGIMCRKRFVKVKKRPSISRIVPSTRRVPRFQRKHRI